MERERVRGGRSDWCERDGRPEAPLDVKIRAGFVLLPCDSVHTIDVYPNPTLSAASSKKPTSLMWPLARAITPADDVITDPLDAVGNAILISALYRTIGARKSDV
ncbi:unnamed protein product [Danaus chrysippus]|uniref:(African queen) hypothetical protein n=1 Tax=Danaus chrysippus TaxID=151541 RepID=A0A8J2QTD8_9NEOP|nr:unnamed protein product [Danaus chrysippus]